MKSKVISLGFALLCTVLISAKLTGRVAAEAIRPAGPIVSTTATVLRLVPLGPQPLAKQFSATAVLTDASATPITNTTVNFLIGDTFVGQTRTNSQGQATVNVNTDVPAGTYTLRAIFLGTRQYDGSRAETQLVITPTTFVIQTIPPLPNIQFKLGDQVFTSDKDGFARLQMGTAGDYQLDVLPTTPADKNMRVEFNRWYDDNYVPTRSVHIPMENTLQVGFEIGYRVGQTFVDLQNKPVDPSRVTTITMKSSQGSTYTFSDGQPRWLPASLVTRRATGLEVVTIQYSVISVVVDGSNVVSSEQQRFYTHAGDVWPVQLLLFSARFSAHDAFLRSPVGKGIILDYPDGSRSRFFFGLDHSVSIPSLARGIYHVQVFGVSGYAPSTPVALSQNQDMALSILSQLDIFSAVTLGSMFALGLIVVGRTQVLSWLRLRRRGGAAPKQTQPSLSRVQE